MDDGSLREFILLPTRGLGGSRSVSSSDLRTFFLQANDARAAGVRVTLAAPATPDMRIIDSIHEDGAKLVEMSPSAVSALRVQHPSLRVVPVVYYEAARAPRQTVAKSGRVTASIPIMPLSAESAAPSHTITVTVSDRADQRPIGNVHVVAFTNFVDKHGAEATTDATGVCQLVLDGGPAPIERIYLYPPARYWGALIHGVQPSRQLGFALDRVQPGFADGLQLRYRNSASPFAGRGVVVGVVDKGVELGRADLVVDGGRNTVTGEAEADFGDNGTDGHGTHVAGIIAGQGPAPRVCGLAPRVRLRSYRVFGRGSNWAKNFAVAKAIDQAVADGCDIINLSLTLPDADDAVSEAIEDAYLAGTMVIAAAGNSGRQPVSFPASHRLAIGVSALGRKGTFPAGTVDESDVDQPFGADPDDYIPLFSNFGQQIDMTAPGVAIVSTVPGADVGVMSGTSMAAPVVTAWAARLLSQRADILGKARTEERADDMLKLLLGCAASLGFTRDFEGHGLPR